MAPGPGISILTQVDPPSGFRRVSPEDLNASSVPDGSPLVVDASLDRVLLMSLPERLPEADLVLWWRPDSQPSLTTDDILRLGIPLVFELSEVIVSAVPAGRTVPTVVRRAGAPSAEYVTLLGTESARRTLADVTRAVTAMRRPTPRPLWDPTRVAGDLKRTIDPKAVLGAWVVGPDGHLDNPLRPALASLLTRANQPTADAFAAYLDGLDASVDRAGGEVDGAGDAGNGYRIPPAALILGESGTGKTVMARRLHEALYPDDHEVRPFVELSAPTIRGNEFATEFFGHLEEAWSEMGYSAGPALEATFGTLFIDELGDLDPRAQQSLLTFLVRRRARLQGRQSDLFLPLHIVAATNRPLDQMVEEGSFRQDLYNRFPLVIRLQPLRDRMQGYDDAERLITEVLSDSDVNPVLDRGPRAGQLTVEAVHEDAVRVLEAHDYRTGNFREFIDILRRGVRTAVERRSRVLLAEHLMFPPTVVESLVGDPIPVGISRHELLTRLDLETRSVPITELTRLARRVDGPLLITTDGHRVLIHTHVAYLDTEA